MERGKKIMLDNDLVNGRDLKQAMSFLLKYIQITFVGEHFATRLSCYFPKNIKLDEFHTYAVRRRKCYSQYFSYIINGYDGPVK